MKLFCNILLGLCAVLAVALLVLQGFLLPALAGWVCVLLRIAGAVCLQLLLLRVTENRLVQAIPLMAAGALAVWGFFLYLTSPSWLGATFGSFLADYAAPLFGCCLVWLSGFLQPWLYRLRKRLKRRKKPAGKKKRPKK